MSSNGVKLQGYLFGLMGLAFAIGAAIASQVDFVPEEVVTGTPIILVVVFIGYALFWHTAWTNSSEVEAQGQIESFRALARVCAILSVVLIAVTMWLFVDKSRESIKTALAVDIGVAITLSGVILYSTLNKARYE